LERSSRLRKYHRKDYTQSVDFPVEIVGRDGRVRRYSYDESVRLYQRRIRSAIARLDDSELVDAEVRHCKLRIEQLRRSFLEQHGEGAGQGQVMGTLLGAEVYAFLARQGTEGLDLGSLKLVATGSGDTLWIASASGRSFLVYAWRMDGDGARSAFAAQRRVLDATPGQDDADVGDGAERLLVAWETPEVGILLAGRGPWQGGGFELVEGDVEVAEGPAEAVALRALKEGNIGDSVRIFEEAMEQAPLRPSLALATAAVALLDQQVERARFAASFGLLHAPVGDPVRPLLGAVLGVALFRLHDQAGARDVLAGTRGAALNHAVSLLLELSGGRVAGLLRNPVDAGPGQRAVAWVRAWGLRWCAGAVAGSAGVGAVAAAAYPANVALAAALSIAAVGVPVAVLVHLARRAGRILRAEEEPGLLLGMELLGARARSRRPAASARPVGPAGLRSLLSPRCSSPRGARGRRCAAAATCRARRRGSRPSPPAAR